MIRRPSSFHLTLLLAIVVVVVTGLPALSRSVENGRQRPPTDKEDERTVAQANPTQDKRQAPRTVDRNRADQRNNANRNRSGVTVEREAAALTFVEQHHQELRRLLQYLKRHRPADYDRAIRDLFRKSEQLAVIKERGDDERHDLELNIWKADSRATLLAARIQTHETPKLQEQLRQTLARKLDYQEQLLRRDRDRLVERLDKMNTQLIALESSRDDRIERQMRMMLRRAESQSNRRSNNGREKSE